MTEAPSASSIAAPLARQLAALDSLLRTAEEHDVGYQSFLQEFRYHVSASILTFLDVDELHYALYEEWHLVKRSAKWVRPAEDHNRRGADGERRRRRPAAVCCCYKKSTLQRPLLEAACRAGGHEFPATATRFALAALLEPQLPEYCETHAGHARPGLRGRKRDRPEPVNDVSEVFMRGTLVVTHDTATIAGRWSTDDFGADADDAPDETWPFSYRSFQGIRTDGEKNTFSGFFRVDEETVIFESRLDLEIRASGAAGEGEAPADEFEIQGDGENEFGAFSMRGRAKGGALNLVRTYNKTESLAMLSSSDAGSSEGEPHDDDGRAADAPDY
ncbi:hypothetical protein M885DRAFT_623572 [Pelagophyceae sp. CCMP2097]|nr:hypothetical protein M885DRAFT_623572 [Pelagophyceae sp. CCMP2097]